MPGPPIRLARALLAATAVALVLAGGGLGGAGAQVPGLPESTLPPPSESTLAPLPTLVPETTVAPAPEFAPPPPSETAPEPTAAPAVLPAAPAPEPSPVTTVAPAATPRPTAAAPAPATTRPDPGFSVTLPYPEEASEPPREVALGAADEGGTDRRATLLAVAGGLLALALVSHLRVVSAEIKRLQ